MNVRPKFDAPGFPAPRPVEFWADKFNLTYAQLGAQYAKDLTWWHAQHEKAVASGKKVRGYTAAQIAEIIHRKQVNIARCNELATKA